MNRWNLACMAIALAWLAWATPPAAAQDRGSGVIRCESQNNRERVCSTGWRNARMVRQLSGSPCDEGRTWGTRNGSIWVNSGCRAEFVEAGGWGGGGWGGNPGQDRTVRCESQSNRQQQCPVGWRNARLVRQLSGTQCIEGQNWGVRNGSIWVDRGCRAEFAEAGGGWGGGNGWGGGRGDPNYTVTCSSNSNRQQSCDWDPRQGRPVLQQQLSGSACAEGRSWGYSGGRIWVSNGCRARFGTR